MVMRAQVTLPMTSNNPLDVAINTFHFQMNNVAGDMAQAEFNLKAFYDRFRGRMSRHVDLPKASVKWYDLTQPKPRPPVRTALLNLLVGTGTPVSLPHEVAICISYHADYLAGVPNARRRGRLYIGPLSTDSMTDGAPSAGLITDLTGAAATFLLDTQTAANYDWIVQSTMQTSINNQVKAGWVDNAFDTQRRRGPDATARTLWDHTGVVPGVLSYQAGIEGAALEHPETST